MCICIHGGGGKSGWMCWWRGKVCFLLSLPLVFNRTPKSTLKGTHPWEGDNVLSPGHALWSLRTSEKYPYLDPYLHFVLWFCFETGCHSCSSGWSYMCYVAQAGPICYVAQAALILQSLHHCLPRAGFISVCHHIRSHCSLKSYKVGWYPTAECLYLPACLRSVSLPS